jgi:hypothetical protein
MHALHGGCHGASRVERYTLSAQVELISVTRLTHATPRDNNTEMPSHATSGEYRQT